MEAEDGGGGMGNSGNGFWENKNQHSRGWLKGKEDEEGMKIGCRL